MTDDIVWSPRLGARLEASRVQAGKRRLDLAAQLGVSEETIRLWEKGAVQPSADRLARLIAVLSLETSEWSAPADPSHRSPAAGPAAPERTPRTRPHPGRRRQDPRCPAGHLRGVGDGPVDAGASALQQPGRLPRDRRARRRHPLCDPVHRRYGRVATRSASSSAPAGRSFDSPERGWPRPSASRRAPSSPGSSAIARPRSAHLTALAARAVRGSCVPRRRAAAREARRRRSAS